MGTAPYMSPEQAKGKPVDKRTDIFAFGCVLYEILSGKRAFDGNDVADVLGAVLRAEPDWSQLPADLPMHIRQTMELCLQKDPKRRRRDAGDVALDLELKPQAAIPQPAATRSLLLWLGTVAAVMSVLFVIVTSMYVRGRNKSESPEMRVEIDTPPSAAPLEFALSPDGRYIVYVAAENGPKRLWLRPLNKPNAQPIAGTEDADFPFWSPDSRSVGFGASGKLKTVVISGGPPQ